MKHILSTEDELGNRLQVTLKSLAQTGMRIIGWKVFPFINFIIIRGNTSNFQKCIGYRVPSHL